MTADPRDAPRRPDPLSPRDRELIVAMDAAERAAAPGLPADAPLDPERRRRVNATWPELLAQPDAVRATWAASDSAVEELAERTAADLAERRLRRVLLVGAGDSLAVMIAARGAMESCLGVAVEPVQSLDLAFYPPPDLAPDVLVVALSSSGATPRTVEAALVARAAGAATVALTNTPTSPLAAECADTLLVEATRVGWPTQSSTAALALLLRLAVRTGQRAGRAAAQELAGALDAAPEQMAATTTALDAQVRDVVTRGDLHRPVIFSGGGPDWGAAVMGAAKVRECTPGHAAAVQLEEFHHYNSLKAGEPLWLLAPTGRCLARAVDTAREAVRWGGSVHVVTTAGQRAFDDLADDVLELPPAAEELSALLSVLPAQMVGHHLAVAQFAQAEQTQAEQTQAEQTQAEQAQEVPGG